MAVARRNDAAPSGFIIQRASRLRALSGRFGSSGGWLIAGADKPQIESQAADPVSVLPFGTEASTGSTDKGNYRAENCHLPFRRRARAMMRFPRMWTLQKFTSVHANVHNHFNQECRLINREIQ